MIPNGQAFVFIVFGLVCLFWSDLLRRRELWRFVAGGAGLMAIAIGVVLVVTPGTLPLHPDLPVPSQLIVLPTNTPIRPTATPHPAVLTRQAATLTRQAQADIAATQRFFNSAAGQATNMVYARATAQARERATSQVRRDATATGLLIRQEHGHCPCWA